MTMPASTPSVGQERHRRGRHRTQQLHVGTGGDQAGLSAASTCSRKCGCPCRSHDRPASVLATLGEDTAQRIAQAQHEVGRDHALPDPATDAVRAEVLCGHPSGYLRRGLPTQHGEQIGQAVAQFAAIADLVDGTVLQQELRTLEPSGSFSRTVCSITRGPAKPIRYLRFGDVDVAQHRERRRNAPVVG